MLINTQFRFVNTELAFVYGGGDAGLAHFLKTVSRRLDENPQAEISDQEREFVDRLLADSWDAAERQYGPDPDRWNEKAQQEVTERILPYYGSLDGFPSLDRDLDLRVPALRCVDGATIFSQAAQAYVQWVPLAAVDTALSLLPPGPCEDPGSGLRTVNMESWQQGALRAAPLSRQAVANITARQEVLLPLQ
jgi:acyl-homoserine lactone acylase PvdQ